MRGHVLAALTLLCLAGCAQAADHDPRDRTPAASSAAGGGSTSDPATDEYVEPQPDGTYTESCDYLLGDFTESETGYRFVADARLRNTGNIGTVTRVTARWFLAGGAEVTARKSVRMEPGTSRRVGFVRVATQDEIDRHQALGYSQQTCTVKAAMVDTFGEPRG